ncbi:MAG: hypothetical protein AMJ92_05115 [candidate division Zixibacteria bacterium SM23_81]|nr:MAG: hypothetical protein AMJ92_05115 [candidate division Zixibacteria bacterium SM23_81]
MVDNKTAKADVLQMIKTALESLDTETLVSCYADEFVFEGIPSNETVTNKEELRPYFQRLFSLPNVQFSNVLFFACEDKGAGEWVWSGTKPSSGVEYSVRGASLIKLRDGKISRETLYFDPRPALP